ncbi:PTS transporter subunit IIC [Macrococcus brunensis]|uniref:PTS transporter subunit IIC n=1 Tax=Macrococcus brunensis TaxID=198483 RepID=A0A4V3BD36_9STAP|nr:PTS sugar transporter subunit IIC [Macrococcus brunensis]TDL93419.1 PTS transporter subunit IIC [Macrococcus brunensis]
MTISKKQFFFNIINGMATGIVVALIPNALLGELFKYLVTVWPALSIVSQALVLFQFCASLFIGALVAYQFKMNAVQTAIVAGASFVGSGAAVMKNGAFTLVGIGDLINIMLVVTLSVAIILALGSKMGSLNIVFLPVLAGVIPGIVGLLTLPYVRMVTGTLGQMVEHFTTLNPLLMCILICVTYSMLMASPISLVAIATVISLSGLGSGAANLGIAACCYTFIFGSWFVNSKGVNTTLVIGAAKMMMPVLFKNPVIFVALLLNGIVGGLCTYFFNIQGTPMSAGFGYTGLVGPINAFALMDGSTMSRIINLLFAYLIIPVPMAFIIHMILKKILPGYRDEVYRFTPEA